jgi:hypothetical protein
MTTKSTGASRKKTTRFARGNRAAAKDSGPRSMWSGRLPLTTQQLARAIVARGLADSQSDALADAMARHAAALGITTSAPPP